MENTFGKKPDQRFIRFLFILTFMVLAMVFFIYINKTEPVYKTSITESLFKQGTQELHDDLVREGTTFTVIIDSIWNEEFAYHVAEQHYDRNVLMVRALFPLQQKIRIYPLPYAPDSAKIAEGTKVGKIYFTGDAYPTGLGLFLTPEDSESVSKL